MNETFKNKNNINKYYKITYPERLCIRKTYYITINKQTKRVYTQNKYSDYRVAKAL